MLASFYAGESVPCCSLITDPDGKVNCLMRMKLFAFAKEPNIFRARR